MSETGEFVPMTSTITTKEPVPAVPRQSGELDVANSIDQPVIKPPVEADTAVEDSDGKDVEGRIKEIKEKLAGDKDQPDPDEPDVSPDGSDDENAEDESLVIDDNALFKRAAYISIVGYFRQLFSLFNPDKIYSGSGFLSKTPPENHSLAIFRKTKKSASVDGALSWAKVLKGIENEQGTARYLTELALRLNSMYPPMKLSKVQKEQGVFRGLFGARREKQATPRVSAPKK